MVHPGANAPKAAHTPPLPIVNHRRVSNESKQQERPSVGSRAGAAGSSAGRFPGEAAPPPTTLRREAPCRWPVLHALPFPSGRSLGPECARLHLWLGAAGYACGRSPEEDLLPGRHHSHHLFTMRHKAFWSALEYTCRLLGISTAAGKSELSLLGIKRH